MIRLFPVAALLFMQLSRITAQDLYYKNPGPEVIWQMEDSARRVVIQSEKKDSLLLHQFNFVLQFYPRMLVKNIIVDFKNSKRVVKTRPYFSSVFKQPSQRFYHITFSEKTRSTLDSVLIGNLNFNSQLGLISSQVAMIEDMSTGGFFNFLTFFIKQLSPQGKNQLHRNAEERCLDVGLGYQLLSVNEEFAEKLKIENWMSTVGYRNYIRHYRNRPMRPEKILSFIDDLPIYITHTYK